MNPLILRIRTPFPANPGDSSKKSWRLMQTDIKEQITEKLVNIPFEIKAVVIYGSYARKAPEEDSDIDILLVSDQVNPKRHRRGREIAIIKGAIALGLPLDILLLTNTECISNFRNHNPLFLDIAWEGIVLLDEDDFLKGLIEETKEYILERGIKKLDDGWIFPVQERIPVLLSKVSNKDFAIAMLTDGERDFRVGVDILEKGYFDKAVYHFQQAVEKFVKAILICFGVFKKTHFVGDILLKDIAERKLDEEWNEKLSQLARISSEIEPEVTWSRYPGIDNDELWQPCEEYTAGDADKIKCKCEKSLKITTEFIAWWFQ